MQTVQLRTAFPGGHGSCIMDRFERRRDLSKGRGGEEGGGLTWMFGKTGSVVTLPETNITR